jgi:hypothetical protein
MTGKKGKKGKKGKRKGGKKWGKKGGHKSKPIRVFATAGVAKTVYDVETTPAVMDNQKNLLFHPSVAAAKVVLHDASYVGNQKAKPALYGILISYGDKLPIVGKPYQKLVKKHLDAIARSLLGKGFRA